MEVGEGGGGGEGGAKSVAVQEIRSALLRQPNITRHPLNISQLKQLLPGFKGYKLYLTPAVTETDLVVS